MPMPAPAAWPPTAQHLVLDVQKTPSRKLTRPTDAAAVAGAAPRSISGSGTVRTCAGVGAADANAACAPTAGPPGASAVAAMRARAPVAARASIPVRDLLHQATARGHTIRSFIYPPEVGNERVERPHGSLQVPRSAELPARGRNTPFCARPERGINTYTEPFPSWLCFAYLQYVDGLSELPGAPGGGRSRPARGPVPLHRARTAISRPDSRRQALRGFRRACPLAGRRPAHDRADRNPLTLRNRPDRRPPSPDLSQSSTVCRTV